MISPRAPAPSPMEGSPAGAERLDDCVACASDRCLGRHICPRYAALSSVYRGGNIAFMPQYRNGLIHLDGQLDWFETVSLWSFGGRTRYFQDGAQFESRDGGSA